MTIVERALTDRLRRALSDTPVVLLNGARQTGKTTLARELAGKARGRYITLDEPAALESARADPAGLTDSADGLVVIDEAQKAPELFGAIKRAVDAHRQPGRFLLTGSADIFMSPDAAESLAGRMEILTLHPLAQAELERTRPRFIADLFAGRPSRVAVQSADFRARLAAGGFPEAVARAGDRRLAWFESYVTTITQRDIRDLSAIEGLTALPRLLSLMALRSGALLNGAELARSTGIAQATLRRYLALLEATFLLQPLPAWHANLGKRLIKAPKTYLLDSGLACALSGVDAGNVSAAPHYGGLLETFVLGELRRLLSGTIGAPRLYHYRSAGGVEVDFVLEDAAGRIVGIEVKATQSLGERHFSGLKDLAQAVGDRFAAGVVLYGGREPLRFGAGLHAAPIAALWQAA